MDLLFSNSKEIKEALGFVDADISFEDMKSELMDATNLVISEVGQDVYDFAVRCYSETLEPGEVMDEKFLHWIQRAIILGAFREYAPLNDLSYTNNGRVMRSDEHQKTPFEWMVVRSDQMLEKKYYRAMDSLILHLDQHNVADWHDTDFYKDAKSLLVSSLSEFDNIYKIESRLLFQRLLPALRMAQRLEVQPRMSESSFSELLNSLKDDNIEIDETTMFHSRSIMVFYALSWAMDRFSVALLPDRIVQEYFSNVNNVRASAPPQGMQSGAASQRFKEDMRRACVELENHLKPAPTDEEIKKPLYDFPMDCDDLFISG